MTKLYENQTIRELNFNLNPVGNDGGMAIAEMLRVFVSVSVNFVSLCP